MTSDSSESKKSLRDILLNSGKVIQGNLSRECYILLNKTYKKETTEQGIALESQQLDLVNTVGLFSAICATANDECDKATGLIYAVDPNKLRTTDYINFSDCVNRMNPSQIDNTLIVVNDINSTNSFFSRIKNIAKNYGIKVIDINSFGEMVNELR